MYKNFIKRVLDLTIGIVVLILLLPFVFIVIIILVFSNSGKLFFLQIRPGRDGKLFKIIKFKTMIDKTDLNGNLLPDDIRLTKVGKIVRKLSLDEVPQLINVIKGDMSLIGPRPLLPEYLPLYNEFQKRRHEVKPGITGWAQVNGRNAISWDKKFEYDVYYVDNLSFTLDMKTMWLTIKKVIEKEGISSDTSATMEKFKGN